MSKRTRETPYDSVKERALLFITDLLDYKNIKWRWVAPNELDLIAPWRSDSDFGAVLFNVMFGKGSDFANRVEISESQMKQLGEGFTKEDFRYDPGSFDIVGLWLRVYKLDVLKDYGLAARLLSRDLDLIKAGVGQAQIEKARVDRQKKIDEYNDRKTKYVKRADEYWPNFLCAWETEESSRYLVDYRGIKRPEPWVEIDLNGVVRFHRMVWYRDDQSKSTWPALLFKISDKPNWDGGQLKGIHRVYLARDGSNKAPVLKNKKEILKGGVNKAGHGIWFGDKSERLWICEGPECALDLLLNGECEFVCCALDAKNMSTLKIPKYVREIIICGDNDETGRREANNAVKEYTKLSNVVVTCILPKTKKDWNDNHYNKHELSTLIGDGNVRYER